MSTHTDCGAVVNSPYDTGSSGQPAYHRRPNRALEDRDQVDVRLPR